jgi:hypothetical protein
VHGVAVVQLRAAVTDRVVDGRWAQQDPDGNEHVISSPLTKKPVVQKLPPVSRSAN